MSSVAGSAEYGGMVYGNSLFCWYFEKVGFEMVEGECCHEMQFRA